MQIISTFKDYYDRHMIFDGTKWFRNQEVSKIINKEISDLLNQMPNPHHRMDTSKQLFFFCGQPYGCYTKGMNPEQVREKAIEDIAVLQWYNESSKRSFAFTVRTYQIGDKIVGRLPFNPVGWREFENRLSKLSKDTIIKFHKQFNTPILKFEEDGDKLLVTRNARLPETFGTLLPAPQAYQALDQFIYDHLSEPRMEVPDRTDIEIRDSHGFDKLSFRKPKEL